MEGLTKQQSLVMDYLARHEYITTTISILSLGVTDLRKRISELRKMGIQIEDRTVTKKNRYGDKVSHKEYYLGKDFK